MKAKIYGIRSKNSHYEQAKKSYPSVGYFICPPPTPSSCLVCVYDLTTINRAVVLMLAEISNDLKFKFTVHNHGICAKTFSHEQFMSDTYLLVKDNYVSHRDINVWYYNTILYLSCDPGSNGKDYLLDIAKFISNLPIDPADYNLDLPLVEPSRLTNDDMVKIINNHTNEELVFSILEKAKINNDMSGFLDAMKDFSTKKKMQLHVNYDSLIRGDHEALKKFKGECTVYPSTLKFNPKPISVTQWDSPDIGLLDSSTSDPHGSMGNYIIAFGNEEDAREFVGLLYNNNDSAVTVYAYNDVLVDALDVQSKKEDSLKVHIEKFNSMNNRKILATISFMPTIFSGSYVVTDITAQVYVDKVHEIIKAIFGDKPPIVGFMTHNISQYAEPLDQSMVEYIETDENTICFNTESRYKKPPRQRCIIDLNDLPSSIQNITEEFDPYANAQIYDLVVNLDIDKYTPSDLKNILNKMRLLRIRINSIILNPNLTDSYPGILYSDII